MKMKYKISLVLICLLLIGSIFLGTSYSIWQHSNIQEGTNEVKVGCFTITYTNLASYGGEAAGDIHLVNTYPISDEAGASLTPYMFSIKNECSIASDYVINLETLNTSNYNLDYLRLKFNDVNNVTNNTSSKYTQLEEGNIVLTEESNAARILARGHIEQNEEKTYSLRVWVDKDATVSTPNVMGKTWNGKVVVYAEAAKNEEQTIAQKITKLSTSSESIVSDETDDNNLRYIGANPDNYVSFNGELWRIIGVMSNIQTEGGQTESLVKIIRNSSLGKYSWDTSVNSINGGYGINQWGPSGTYEGADIMRELNTDYLGNVTVGTDDKWYSGENNAKNNTKPESTLNSQAQSMIESVVWKLGSPSSNNGSYDGDWSETMNVSTTYARERANTNGKTCSVTSTCNDEVERTSTWTGKVALMYPSDYLYATSGGATTNRSACLNTAMHRWNGSEVSDCNANDWLYDSSYEQWTLSPSSRWSFSYDSYIVTRMIDSYSSKHAADIRPVVYLKSTVKIASGTGTESDPFVLE